MHDGIIWYVRYHSKVILHSIKIFAEALKQTYFTISIGKATTDIYTTLETKIIQLVYYFISKYYFLKLDNTHDDNLKY